MNLDRKGPTLNFEQKWKLIDVQFTIISVRMTIDLEIKGW